MKTLKLIFPFIALLLLLSWACNDDDDNPAGNCDQVVLINEAEFNSAPNDPLSIDTMEIRGNCLHITFRAGGCDGNSWLVELIDSEEIEASVPPQRNLKLSLKNEENCEAMITREISFNIHDLQLDGNQVLLKMDDNIHQVLYEY